MGVYISVDPQDIEKELDLSEVKKFAEDLLKALGREDLELSVLLTDDERIRELNKRWRGKDRPTDVLSFQQDFPEREFDENLSPEEELERALKECKNCQLLGDVVISVDTAKRQAKDLGLTLSQEIKRLLVHGVVHLLGFDHETSIEDAQKFRAIEKLLMDRLNLSAEGIGERC